MSIEIISLYFVVYILGEPSLHKRESRFVFSSSNQVPEYQELGHLQREQTKHQVCILVVD